MGNSGTKHDERTVASGRHSSDVVRGTLAGESSRVNACSTPTIAGMGPPCDGDTSRHGGEVRFGGADKVQAVHPS